LAFGGAKDEGTKGVKRRIRRSLTLPADAGAPAKSLITGAPAPAAPPVAASSGRDYRLNDVHGRVVREIISVTA